MEEGCLLHPSLTASSGSDYRSRERRSDSLLFYGSFKKREASLLCFSPPPSPPSSDCRMTTAKPNNSAA